MKSIELLPSFKIITYSKKPCLETLTDSPHIVSVAVGSVIPAMDRSGLFVSKFSEGDIIRSSGGCASGFRRTWIGRSTVFEIVPAFA